ISGEPRIEVYEIDGIEIIAEFTNITSNEYNQIFLTNLQGTQDTFDLRIVGGSIEIDYIVDPYAWISPFTVSSCSGDDGINICNNSVDEDIDSEWEENSGADTDGSIGEWFLTVDMGNVGSVSDIRIYTDAGVRDAPCSVVNISVCDDADCIGESNLIDGSPCIFGDSGETWYA
ncbi:unnamed protein product, partial [marine sediment metagenome]